MSATRRVFFYVVTLAALAVFAAGVGNLLALLFDTTIRVPVQAVGRPSFSGAQFSLGVAMVVIGGPLWFFFWRAIQKRVAASPEETGAALRKLYLNLVLLVSATTFVGTASTFLRWLLQGVPRTDTPVPDMASVIVTALIWVFHWRVSEHEGHPTYVARTLRRWYVYILSALGLAWLSVGVVSLVSAATLVLPVWSGTLVRSDFWNVASQEAVASAVLGGAIWYFHWFRAARGDFDSVLRQVYFYLFTITGGAIAALVALTTTVFRTLEWVFGAAQTPAGQHFQFLAWSVMTVLVGAAIWSYHQRLVQDEQAQATERRLSARRVYLYLMSFIGLGTFAAGLAFLMNVLLSLIVNAISPPIATGGGGGWRQMLSLCISLLVVGGPLWLYYWRQVVASAQAGGITEARSRSRRVFLYAVVVITIGALVADMVNIVYQILNGILQSRSAVESLRDMLWSLDTLVVAAPLLWYHWRTIRTEQHRGAEPASVQKSVTLLTSDRSGTLVSRLEAGLGYRIRVLYLAPQELAPIADEDLATLAGEIQAASTRSVMVVTIGGKLVALPYQER